MASPTDCFGAVLRPGLTFADASLGAVIVSMVQWKDMLVIATPHKIFRVYGGRLEEMKFTVVEPDAQA